MWEVIIRAIPSHPNPTGKHWFMDTPLKLYLYTLLATTFLQANVCYQMNFTVDSLYSACVHILYEEKQT